MVCGEKDIKREGIINIIKSFMANITNHQIGIPYIIAALLSCGIWYSAASGDQTSSILIKLQRVFAAMLLLTPSQPQRGTLCWHNDAHRPIAVSGMSAARHKHGKVVVNTWNKSFCAVAEGRPTLWKESHFYWFLINLVRLQENAPVSHKQSEKWMKSIKANSYIKPVVVYLEAYCYL